MQQLQKTTLTSLLAHYEPLVIAGLVFVAHLVLRAADRILVGVFNDDGAYGALGHALAGGGGCRLIYLAGDPVAGQAPPRPPPPGRRAKLPVRSPAGLRPAIAS